MHFQHSIYNLGFERLHKMPIKFPKTIFIVHAQTWWANIDKNHTDQNVLYPDWHSNGRRPDGSIFSDSDYTKHVCRHVGRLRPERDDAR